jgi:tetratricopeptide (TPR) repeat protein
VARNTLLSHLEKLFEKPTTSTLIVVLLGMGGAGKTQLALEYCRRIKDSGKYQAIFWLDASSRNALYSSMEVIAKHLLPERVLDSDNPDSTVALVRNVLTSWSDGWLMVFDNLDNPSELQDIRKFIPQTGYGYVLVTSRYTGSKELGWPIELNHMEEEEGLQLLLHCSEVDAEELAAAKQILKQLGYLPLAIDQVRAYISHRLLGFNRFLEEYEKRKKDVLKETPLFWEYRRILPGMEEEISLNILTTWEMSLQLLDDGKEGTAKLGDILTLFAFFHQVSISEKIFSNYEQDLDLTSPMAIFNKNGQWNHTHFENAVVEIQDQSLLQFSHRSGNEIVVSLHSMVSEWLHMRLERNIHSTYFTVAISHLNSYLKITHDADHTIWQEAISHIDKICQLEEFHSQNNHYFAESHAFGMVYSDHGHLGDAERMYNHALAGKEEAWGPDHASTLDTVNNLGLLYVDQGHLEDAERMYNRALAGYEKAWGPDHTSMLSTVNNLGILYRNQGRLEDAERMYNRALAGYEKAWGPDHTSIPDIVHNLGLLYADQGHLEDAERMYNRALAGYEKAWGPDHASTLSTFNNLGLLYANQEHLEDAERMYNHALAGYEKAWGPNHTSTLSTVNNLGILYRNQGHLEDAERMYNRALAGYEKAWGPDHTSTLDTVHNLGLLYVDQGHLEDAERMYNRALAGYEKACGPDHTSTLSTVNNLGILYKNQGHFENAERMYNRALAGYEKAWGPDHTFMLDTVSNLGILYRNQGHLEDAERMYNRALAGYEKAWGPDHTSTLFIVHNLGLLYADQGHLENAERMYNRALAGKEKTWGPDHTSTLSTVHNLGLLYANQGRLEDAERMYNRALAGYIKALGPEHTSTCHTADNLNKLYVVQDHLNNTNRM